MHGLRTLQEINKAVEDNKRLSEEREDEFAAIEEAIKKQPQPTKVEEKQNVA